MTISLPGNPFAWLLAGVLSLAASVQAAPSYDLMADTWVGTDGLGRTLPGNADCGNPRTNRPIGIFYFLWHGSYSYGSGTNWDVTRYLAAHPYANPLNPWASDPIFDQVPNGTPFYWAEPAVGYYSPNDPWSLRRQIALLTYAGVDVLIFDYSNAVTYDSPLYALCNMIRQMRSEGFPANLKVVFLTHANSASTATYVYNTFYAPGTYSDLWYYWQGKPLILGNPSGATANVQSFFTWRASWADVGEAHDEWDWIDSATPQWWGYDIRTDIPEQLPVTCGGWATTEFSVPDIGRSYANHAEPAYDHYHLPVTQTQGQGLFFAEQMFYGLKYDPQFLFITGWNEWIAGALQSPTAGAYSLLGQPCPAGGYFFVDEYNEEYSRDIEPMMAGHTDNYFYQMVGQNRLRKGARPIPIASAPQTINLTGDFSDWTNAAPAYYDPINDTLWRNYPSAASQDGTYTNSTGRNDFAVLKVARDTDYLYFLAQCASNLTSYTGSNWMVLFIDADQNHTTGWEGYDFAVNLGGVGPTTTTLSRNTTTTNGWTWATIRSDVPYTVRSNQLMLRLARADLGLGPDPISFDFHWADNFQVPGDISDFGINGDSAPDRRFNYRYQTQKSSVVTLGSDDFESGKQPAWTGAWSPGSRWDLTSATSYSPSHCAECNLAQGTNNGALMMPLDPSGCSSFRVSFRYKLQGVSYVLPVNVSYLGSNGWVTVRNLARDQYYSSGQAWGYQERQSVWLYFTDVRYNRGADAQFFTNGFALKIDGSPFSSTSQVLWIDDFQVTGVVADQGVPVGATVVKADNEVTLLYGQSWVGGAPPGTGQLAVWDGTVSGPNTTLLGTDTAWQGLQIADPGGPVTITGANRLTLGASGINMSAASQDLTLNLNLLLGSSQTWDVAYGQNLVVNGAIAGAFPLDKNGAGGLVLAGLNTWTGGLNANQGVVTLANSSLGAGDVIVKAGATLAGTGTILGAVTVQDAGTLSPGNGFGTLAISNNVTLGGTTILAIGKSGTNLLNDRLTGVATLSYGGTLVVTNLGGTFSAGDSFRLFAANSYQAMFNAKNLPVLTNGLYWDTSQLAVNGALSVAAIPSLTSAFDGASLLLTWPTNYVGWQLEGQTNPPPTGLGTNWVPIEGVISNTAVLPVNEADASAFFRLRLAAP